MVAGLGFIINTSLAYSNFDLTLKTCTFLTLPYMVGSTANVIFNLAIAIYRLIAFKHPMKAHMLSRPSVICVGYLLTALYIGASWRHMASSLAQSNREDETVGICTLIRLMPASPGAVAVISLSIMLSTIFVNILLFLELVNEKRKANPTNTVRDVRMAESMQIITAVYILTAFLSAVALGVARRVLTEEQLPAIGYLFISPIGSINYAANYIIYACRSHEYRVVLPCKKNSIFSTTDPFVGDR